MEQEQSSRNKFAIIILLKIYTKSSKKKDLDPSRIISNLYAFQLVSCDDYKNLHSTYEYNKI